MNNNCNNNSMINFQLKLKRKSFDKIWRKYFQTEESNFRGTNSLL